MRTDKRNYTKKPHDTAISKSSGVAQQIRMRSTEDTILLPKFQKNIDKILRNIQNTIEFIDDILMVTKRTKLQHMMKVEEVMKVVDEAFSIETRKMPIAQRKTQKLGYQLTRSGVKLEEVKTQATTDKIKPKNLKELRSFMGALNQMKRFIPNLMKLFAPLRPLFRETNERKKGRGKRTNIFFSDDKERITKHFRNETLQKEPTSCV